MRYNTTDSDCEQRCYTSELLFVAFMFSGTSCPESLISKQKFYGVCSVHEHFPVVRLGGGDSWQFV